MLKTQSTCLTNLVVRQEAPSPIQLIELSSQLIPNGKPNFKSIKYFPAIAIMLRDGIATMADIRASLVMLIKNFSDSINVVRNLNEYQAVEIAQMLIDEADDFRLEDYFMMFQLAKRGEIGDIRDRIDIQLISKIHDEYWHYRCKEGAKAQEEEDKRIAEERRENKRKALKSGEYIESSITPEQFKEEIRKLEKSIAENYDKFTLDIVKQNEIKKEMALNRAKQLYGFNDEQMAELERIRVRTFGSKINNDLPSE